MDAFILLFINIKRGKTYAVVTYILIIFGIGTAGHHVRADPDSRINFMDGFFHLPEGILRIIDNRTGIILVNNLCLQIVLLRFFADQLNAFIRLPVT